MKVSTKENRDEGMATIVQQNLQSLLPFPVISSSSSSSSGLRKYLLPLRYSRSRTVPLRLSSSSASSPSSLAMDSQIKASKFMEFPFVSVPHRRLMVELVSAAETRLDSQLQPFSVPPDVQFFQHENGSAQGSIHIRSGSASSQIDFLLGSWIHGSLPSGGALNITSLSANLNASTDAPNFLLELIQKSPNSLILILDLPPRKDLILNPEYLKTFYEETKLDSLRQKLEHLPEVRPYFSPSLYIRAVTSPTAIMVRVDTEGGAPGRMEEIVREHISPLAKEAMDIWLSQCACAERNLDEEERKYLEKRGQVTKKKTVEIDLSTSFPRLFGQDVANRVVGVIREVYKV